MKKTQLLIFLLFVAMTQMTFGQGINIFNIDTTNYPTIKAKFYVFDKDGNQARPSASELSITENGVPRTITGVSCPASKPPQNVSIAMSIDISGSMGLSDFGEKPVELGKVTATTLCNSIAMPPSEFALQTCDDKALIIQDFTKNRDKIINAIKPIYAKGGNNFVEHLLNQITGLLNIAKTGKNKRVAVLYTDAWWFALSPKDLKSCIDTCKKYNIEFYTVIYSRPEAEPKGIKSSLNEICKNTGGFLYDGVTSQEVAKDIAIRIQKTAQGEELCDITWESGATCYGGNVNVELSWQNQITKSSYKKPTKAVASLKISPSFVSFGKISNPTIKDTTITLSALNSDFTINDIKLKFGSSIFSIVNTNFPLTIPKNTSKTITLRCTPIDSSFNYVSFEIETNLCSFYFSANSVFPGKKMTTQTLKLTHPNGGEVFVAGSDTIITWEGISPTDTVSLNYSIDSGKTWKTITNKATGLKYEWKNIPLPSSINCLIKVEQKDLKSNLDTSKTGKLLFTLNGHTSVVYNISWSPDGSRVATSSGDKTGKIWDANSGLLLNTLNGHTGWVYHVCPFNVLSNKPLFA